MNLLDRKPTELLKEFLTTYCRLFGVDYEESLKKINDNIATYNISTEIENVWYESLKEGTPDYGIYDGPNYFVDLWLCFKTFSRKYLRTLEAKGTLTPYFINHSIVQLLSPSSKSVIDVGCGIGYSTAALKGLFPDCKVYGFNIAGTKQFRFCEENAKKYDFTLTGDFNKVGQVDIVFASEYFEHFERPLEHVEELVHALNPQHFIIANSFNTKSIGHFITYKHYEEDIDQSLISRRFNKHLNLLGYEKIKTKVFNSKPSIYTRRDDQELVSKLS